MEGKSFWLIYIQDEFVSVSLVSSNDQNFQILGTGPSIPWNIEIEESLSSAIDESLSTASINANITEDEEPSLAAFVVPPFWVGNDVKIIPSKSVVIKEACKKLSLKPTGFLSEDDSIMEDANSADGFPASFILLHISLKEFYLSLVYLGHVKQRITKEIEGEFTGQLVESALLELNSESALPPQIIVFGQTDPKIVSILKEFPWVGKKNIETFLHFPDIKYLSSSEVIGIFSRVISSQMNPSSKNNQAINDFSSLDETEVLVEENSLIETEPSSLGFFNPDDLNISSPSATDSFVQIDNQSITENLPLQNLTSFDSQAMPPLPVLNKNKKFIFSFNLFKKIKLPKINLKLNNLFWIFLIILPVFIFMSLFLIKSQIIFFMTPYEFNKSIPVVLEIDVDNDQISKSIIPVDKKSFDIVSKATVSTTGQKTIGEKAKGEITIFNKVDKAQNIPKGSILVDSAGKKFELATAVLVAPSTSDLEKGIINLGQTKTTVIALDIGSEYNINSGTQLLFKDFAETLLISKSSDSFTGGNRQQIQAVSQQDKVNVQAKIDEQIDSDIDSKIVKDFNNLVGSLKETMQIKKSNLELSREVGEESEELTGTVKSSVSVFIISDEVKKAITSQFLSSETDFDKIDIDLNNFQVSFKPSKIDSDQASGTLTVSGSSLPKLDLDSLKKKLSLQTVKQADVLIKKLVPRANRFKIYNKFPIMPFKAGNIDIQVKLEKL